MESKWRAIQGKSPSRRDLATWQGKQFICFAQFCLFFVTYSEDGLQSKVSVTKEKWRQAEEFLGMPDHPFQEFLYRINHFTFDPNASEKKFYYKLISMMKHILGYVRSNPGIISDEFRTLVEPHPRLNWCLQQTRVVETAVGPVLAPDKMQKVGDMHSMQSVASIEQRLSEVLSKGISTFELLLSSISADDIKKMTTKDKLLAAARLHPFFTFAKGFKPGKQVFKQINIHAASREDLEKAILAVNKE